MQPTNDSHFRNLVDNALTGIIDNTLEGKILFVNQALASMLEFESPQQMQAQGTLLRWCDLEDRKAFISRLKHQGYVNNYEAEVFSKTGKHLHVLLSARLQGDVISSIVVDITDRKQVEDALLESEEKFRTLVTNTEEIVYMIAKDGTFVLSEGKGLANLGLQPGQIVGKSVFELYKDYPDMLEDMKRAFNGETITNEVNVDGNSFRSWYTPHKNHAGEIIGLLGVTLHWTCMIRWDNPWPLCAYSWQ
jgi:PAS domain S-box-containing protein